MKKKVDTKKNFDSTEFRFKKTDMIGCIDAEEDIEFLHDCFIDNGDIDILLSVRNPRRIILGRTGIGKTALLSHIRTTRDDVIEVHPETLALSHVSNSTLLTNLVEIGVNLDIFFSFLWRHALAVEILQYKYGTPTGSQNWLSNVVRGFSSAKYKSAIKYLENFGSEFWEQRDEILRKVTDKVESELKMSVGSKMSALKAKVGARQLSGHEDSKEIVEKAQNIVNSIQMRELGQILELLDEVFPNPQETLYVLIDELDRNWVADHMKCRLVAGLLEAVKDFRKVRHVKIIVSLRSDLLERVTNICSYPGQQREKLSSLMHAVQWEDQSLLNLLDKRIEKLVRSRYTKKPVTHQNLLPQKVGNDKGVDYFLSRTLRRPRDVIRFFNLCIEASDGSPVISVKSLRVAEGRYSADRCISIIDEWSALYPELWRVVGVLNRSNHRSRLIEFNETCEKLWTELAETTAPAETAGPLIQLARHVYESKNTLTDFRNEIFSVLQKVGMIGLKPRKQDRTIWIHLDERSVGATELNDDSIVEINPMLYLHFGVVVVK